MYRPLVLLASLLAIIALSVIPAGTAHADPGWQTPETVDAGSSNVGEFSSIAVDSSGYPHIAYYDDAFNGLWYASKSASGWSKTMFDGGAGAAGYDRGRYLSLALDDSDHPHISYYDATKQELCYAYYDGSWHTETVDSTGDVGKFSSIAVDSGGHPHISYYDDTSDNLKYAYKDGSGWHTETVDSTGNVGWYNSIALDSSNHPHVSYHDATNLDLKYAYHDSLDWNISTIDSTGDVGFCTSIALENATNYPHISYSGGDFPNMSLKHIYQDATGWQPVENVDTDQLVNWTAIALDSNNHIHVSYLARNSVSVYSVRYAYKDSLWHTGTVVDSIGSHGAWYTSIALDDSDYPHISYHHSNTGSLKYAHNDGSWNTETVDAGSSNVGEFSSIAVDSSGYPHIAYYDDAFNGLWYASKSASGWSKTMFDGGAGAAGYDRGRYLSLALDDSDHPHISYYDATKQELCYAYYDGSWHTETVDSTGDVGKFSSIAVDSGGHPHISYYDDTSDNLKYAYKDGSGWHTETVDSTGNVGWYNSIALDSSNHPHVSYHDATNLDLKYAYHDSLDWNISTIDSTGDVGFCTSIALENATNYPHISYSGGDFPNMSLKHIYQDATGWQPVENVDTGQLVNWTSIAMDSNNHVHVSYLARNAASVYSVRYAYKDSSWHTGTVVDSIGSHGAWYTSIALDDSDYPHISYHYSNNGSLKYAMDICPLTTSTVNAIPSPSVYGQPVTFTTTISWQQPCAPVPTGTVTFMDGAATLGTRTLNASAQATLIISSLSAGNHTISAPYGGDSNYYASAVVPTLHTVNTANTTITLISDANPSVYGQSVTFTATVSAVPPGAGTPTGNVTFMDGATTLGTKTLDASGQASITIDNLTVGDHTITAEYGGDGNFNFSPLNPLAQTVNKANTITDLVSSQNPSVFGQSVTFTATVSAVPPGAGTPTGTVTFKDGGVQISAGALASGQATFTTSTLSVGVHNITAEYGGDGNFNTSASSPPLTQTVNKADTSTALGSSHNPSLYGQSVTFTATVSAVAPGAGIPTGNITFMDGATSLGTRTLDASGQATLTTSSLSIGDHIVTAEYGGDGNFNFSPLSPLAQTVNKADTSTALVSSQNPSVYGQSVNFTATVSAVAPGAGTPTGTVKFKEGSATLSTGNLKGPGQATFTTSSLSAGDHNITAEYEGDGNFNTSAPSPPLTQTVNKADTSTTLGSSQNPSVYGQSVTFTATVTAVLPGAGTSTGTATFKEGTTTLGTGTLASGQATFTTSDLSVGVHNITAEYGGDGNFNTSASSPLTQTVNKADTATTLDSNLNPSVYGEPVTFTATVSAAAPGTGTPTGTVTFKDGGVTIDTATLDASGQVTFTTSDLSVGNHNITTEYGGDGNFNASISNPLTQTVGKADTSTALNSSQNPSVFGQSVTFTATVSAVLPGAGMPSGTVTFKEGAVTLGTGTLASGQATLSTSNLSVGRHTITAEYGGDGNFNTSTSSPLTQTILPTTQSLPRRTAPAPPGTVVPRILVLMLNLQPQQTTSNQPVTILANVFNQDYAEGSYSFELKVNGEVEQTRSGNIDRQAAILLEFEVVKSEPGTYTVEINGHKSFFTIVEKASLEETSNPRHSMSGALIAIIVAGSLVTAFLIYLLIIYIGRRRYYR
ncbi:MAG: Ig-like domain repeat protein [Chloroflexi bacterium]|nr:Ig-like domain repeat protein [Chloroflexota bacterium]